MRELITVF